MILRFFGDKCLSKSPSGNRSRRPSNVVGPWHSSLMTWRVERSASMRPSFDWPCSRHAMREEERPSWCLTKELRSLTTFWTLFFGQKCRLRLWEEPKQLSILSKKYLAASSCKCDLKYRDTTEYTAEFYENDHLEEQLIQLNLIWWIYHFEIPVQSITAPRRCIDNRRLWALRERFMLWLLVVGCGHGPQMLCLKRLQEYSKRINNPKLMINVNLFHEDTLTQVLRFVQNTDDTDGRARLSSWSFIKFLCQCVLSSFCYESFAHCFNKFNGTQ